jgi:hypothetical protein
MEDVFWGFVGSLLLVGAVIWIVPGIDLVDASPEPEPESAWSQTVNYVVEIPDVIGRTVKSAKRKMVKEGFSHVEVSAADAWCGEPKNGWIVTEQDTGNQDVEHDVWIEAMPPGKTECPREESEPGPATDHHFPDVDLPNADHHFPDGALTFGYCARKWWC